MKSEFKRDKDGFYALHDPGADIDYSWPSWIEGATFVSVTWSITGSGTLHGAQINSAPVSVGGVDYAAGEVASVFVTGLTAGITYTVTARATFSGAQVDERSFRLVCVDR